MSPDNIVQGSGSNSGNAIALYARSKPGYDSRVASALQCLQQAAQAHAGSIVFTTSLGAEDMVITDLIARHAIELPLATLQTGRLHAQTLALIERSEQHYAGSTFGDRALRIECFEPEAQAVVRFERTHGEFAMRDSVALRLACCDLRKLQPLARVLAGRSAWITGLRREQSGHRAEVPFEQMDENGRHKFSPLADWSQADVWHYIAEQGVPYNPLHDAFYPSIGCEPCTRAVAVGEDFRAGRWWWEQARAKECGLHATGQLGTSLSANASANTGAYNGASTGASTSASTSTSTSASTEHQETPP